MKIIAHRGNDGVHDENSFEAIINSLSKPYIDGVEFDVRLTKDETYILNHDPLFKSNIIKNSNSIALRRMGLNTLDEILSCIVTDKILLIDVKEDEVKKSSKILYDTLRKYNLNYYVCSFNYEFIKYFHSRYDIKSGLIIGSKLNTNRLDNPFDFNSVSYRCPKKLPKKKTFIWTVNKPEEIRGEYIITDKPKYMSQFKVF